jgi:subtilisin family serine protease
MTAITMKRQNFEIGMLGVLLGVSSLGYAQSNQTNRSQLLASSYTVTSAGPGKYYVSRNGNQFSQSQSGVRPSSSTVPNSNPSHRYIIQFRNEPLYSKKLIPRGSTRPSAAVMARQDSLLEKEHQQALGYMKSRGLQPKREYRRVFNGVALENLADNDLVALERQPFVAKVWPDSVKHVTVDTTSIHAGDVWSMQDSNGQYVQGSSVAVAIIDTGIDYTRPDLGNCYKSAGCTLQKWADFVNGEKVPYDDYGHGTHVAGIVAAHGPIIYGVAPQATLFGYKVCNNSGSCNDSAIINGIEQAVYDKAQVINMSLGGPGNATDALSQATDNAFAAGIVVVVAAGNNGPASETIGSPGAAAGALTVAALDTTQPAPYVMAGFSSRGPAPSGPNFIVKPDAAGPGVDILSTVPTGSCPLCSPSGYASYDGTSMATPHVAGAAALLIQMHPTWTAEEVRAALIETGSDVTISGEEPVYAQGAGIIDCVSSINAKSVFLPSNLSSTDFSGLSSVFTSSTTLLQEDLDGASRSFSTSANIFDPSGVTFPGLSPSLYQIRVDNAQASIQNNSGYFNATAQDQSLRIPIGYSTSSYNVSITYIGDSTILPTNACLANATGVYCAASVEAGNIVQTPLSVNVPCYLSVPPGVYSLFASADLYDTAYVPSMIRIDNEVVSGSEMVDITVSSADAPNRVTIQPLDQNGAPLTNFAGGGMIHVTFPDLPNLWLEEEEGVTIGSTATVYQISNIPNGEIAFKWMGISDDSMPATYVVQGGFTGISSDQVLENNWSQMKSYNFNFPGGHIAGLQAQFCSYVTTPGSFSSYVGCNENYNFHANRIFYFSPDLVPLAPPMSFNELVYSTVISSYSYVTGHYYMDSNGTLRLSNWFSQTFPPFSEPIPPGAQINLGESPLFFAGRLFLNGPSNIEALDPDTTLDYGEGFSHETTAMFNSQSIDSIADFSNQYQYTTQNSSGSMIAGGSFSSYAWDPANQVYYTVNEYDFQGAPSGATQLAIDAYPQQIDPNTSSTTVLATVGNNNSGPNLGASPGIGALTLFVNNTVTDTVDLSTSSVYQYGAQDNTLDPNQTLLELSQPSQSPDWHSVPWTLAELATVPAISELVPPQGWYSESYISSINALYKTTFPSPEVYSGSPISLRLTARDTSGNSIQQAIYAGYQVINNPPIRISSVTEAANCGITITWNTTPPSPSFVQYGMNTFYESSTTWDAALSTHTLTLTGLVSATTYHFLITVKDTHGTYGGWDHWFVTPPAANVAIQSPASASPNPVLGTTSNLSVLGSDTAGDALTYTWSVLGSTSPIIFSPNGTNTSYQSVATFAQAGTYTLQASVLDPAACFSVTSTMTVTVVPTFSSITVNPSTSTVALSGTQSFMAQGTDQFNMTYPLTALNWSLPGGGGTINGVGLFTAGSTVGSYTVTATSGSSSGNATVTIVDDTPPSLMSLSPSSATAGGVGFTLTVNGSGFVTGSSVTWDGSARATTFVNPTTLSAAINAADIATAGPAAVQVVNPGNVISSNALPFTIAAPAPPPSPSLSNLSPSSATAGGAGFTLTVSGTLFANGSDVTWNGTPRTTTYVNATTLSAAVNAADITAAGTATIGVTNPGHIGSSNTLPFTINSPPPLPALTMLAPSSATAGGPGFTLTVTGSGYVSASSVTWNGTPRATTYLNATTLSAAINAADIAAAGTATVGVTNPGSISSSNTLPFTIDALPLPSLSILLPSSTVAGGAGFSLTVNGTAFVAESSVTWNGTPRTTTYVNATTLSAAINAADIAAAGTATVGVTNPGSISSSNTLPFTITAPVVPPPTVATPASASPNPVNGTSTSLSVLGADASYPESSLTYTWSLVGTGPAPVVYSVNGNNAAKATTATFTQAGTYNILVTIEDPAHLTVTSAIPVIVNQTLTTIIVSPSAASVPAYESETFSAVGQDQFGQPLSVQPAFSWSVPSAAGTITGGLFTAGSELGGPFSITATASAESGTAQVTVIAAIPLLTPDLSAWNGMTFPLTASLSLPYTNSVATGFIWSLTPVTSASATRSWSSTPASVTGVSGYRTSAPQLSLASLGLSPGMFVIGAQAVNAYETSGTGMATITLVSSDLGSMRVYPNPWRSDRHSNLHITFDQLPGNSTIKIFTTSAYLVKTLYTNSGSTSWDLTNDSGERVASGVYHYLITNDQGQKTTGQLSIIK